MDFREITTRYYSCWLGKDISACGPIEYVYSAERNIPQAGYSRRYDLWVWLSDGKIIVSYGDMAAEKLDALKNELGSSPDSARLSHALEKICPGELSHGVKYVFRGGAYVPGPARILRGSDYGCYEAFFLKNNPACSDVTWLRDYFDEMNAEGICCGVFTDGELVCCTDAPLMPYMAGEAQEIGVNTLEGYRGRHYAADSARLCAEQIIKNGKCPLWSTDIDNIASQRTAIAAGFIPMAEYMALTLEE